MGYAATRARSTTSNAAEQMSTSSVCTATRQPSRIATVRLHGFRFLAPALGVWLFCAAMLKTHAFFYGGVRSPLFSAYPELHVAVIELELLLSACLVCSWAPRLTWIAATTFFIAASLANIYLLCTGHRECGCLGRVPVSLALIAPVNLAIVAALLFFLPQKVPAARSVGLRWTLGVVTAAALLLMCTVLILSVVNSNSAGGFAALRGEPLLISPRVSNLGSASGGEARTFDIDVTNPWDEPIRLLGGTRICNCDATLDLPLVIQPGETRRLSIKMWFTGSPGTFQQSFVLYTDYKNFSPVTAHYSGEVLVSTNAAVASEP